MATIKLTDGLVESAAPSAQHAYLWDSALPRFGVRITPSGARIYLVQYRARGAAGTGSRTRRITIGRHDGELWNVTKARAAARKVLAQVDLGVDPFAEREKERAARDAARKAAGEARAREARIAEERAAGAFELVLERFVTIGLAHSRSGQETARLLRHGPGKAWAGRHIGDVRRADVAALLDETRRRSPAVARLTYAALRGLFDWCIERDLVDTSPCDRIKAPPRPQARDRVLSDDELRAVWAGCSELGYPFGAIVQLLILTGQRRSEVAGLRWSELDLDARTWRLPKERAKNRKAHEVDLSTQAVEILRRIPDTGDLLFPARPAPARKGAAAGERREAPVAVRGFSAAKRALDKTVGASSWTESWRLHDLRRTVATGLAAMNHPPHIVERVLNHVSGVQSGLVGVYQRHDYRKERREALEAWGRHVEATVSPKVSPTEHRDERQRANVVDMGARRRTV